MRRRSSAVIAARSVAAATAWVLAACGSSSTGASQFDSTSEGGMSSGTAGSLGGGGTLNTGLDTDGSSSNGDAMDQGDGCGQTTLQGSSKEVDILLVIDKSGSMSATPTGFAMDKWAALKAALSAALDPVKGGISFGVELFPNNLTTPIPVSCTTECWDMPPGDSAIEVPVGPGTTTLPNIITKLSVTPSGGTPTRAALDAAYQYFTAGAGKALGGDKYVLLATDGGPNGNTTACQQATCTVNMDRNEFGNSFPNYCDANLVADGPKSCLDDAATVAQLTTLATAGIKTFVVGIPGTEPYVSTLDALAVAGGAPASATSPKYYAVTAAGGVDGLKQAFATITHQLIKTCDIQLASDPPDHNKLNVYIDGKVVPQAGPDGWDLVSSDASTFPVVELKGATCAAIEANGANNVQIVYGCKDTVIN
jgi:hypothetical protein